MRKGFHVIARKQGKYKLKYNFPADTCATPDGGASCKRQ